MKRKSFGTALLILALMVCLAGCGSGKKGNVLEGVVEEKKDFMLVVNQAGTPYAISWEGEQPEGYEQINIGDMVLVEYTGELSMVDAFTGEVLSIEKVD